jgi:hypothetical protein
MENANAISADNMCKKIIHKSGYVSRDVCMKQQRETIDISWQRIVQKGIDIEQGIDIIR